MTLKLAKYFPHIISDISLELKDCLNFPQEKLKTFNYTFAKIVNLLYYYGSSSRIRWQNLFHILHSGTDDSSASQVGTRGFANVVANLTTG